jgi:hypothetical protein
MSTTETRAHGEGPLRAVAPNVWVAEIPHRFVGLHIGTRMTVVRLSNGTLLLHSPIAMTPALVSAIRALGEVSHIVCPNLFHHVYAGEAVRAFPGAALHGPAQLHRKRRDLAFASALSESPHPDWATDLEAITIEGSLLRETVFFHRASRTLISADLVENFAHMEHGFTRFYLKAGGVLGRPGWHPLLRPLYYRRKAARAAIERILALPIETAIVSHGDVLTRDPVGSLRAGLAWL